MLLVVGLGNVILLLYCATHPHFSALFFYYLLSVLVSHLGVLHRLLVLFTSHALWLFFFSSLLRVGKPFSDLSIIAFYEMDWSC